MKILFLLLAAATPEGGDRFDLVCSGTKRFVAVGEDRSEPFSMTFHVDLEQRRWCQGSCGAINDIHNVQPALLELRAPVEIDTVSRRELDSEFIDRETGAYKAYHSVGRGARTMFWQYDGICEKRPFSGFPEVQTKF